MILSFLQIIVKPIFGDFGREEFKKFLRMGVLFAVIIGSYWTLRPLKNAIFCTLVGAAWLPWAKTASLIVLVPLIMLYTKLLDTYPREKVFYILSVVYSCVALVIGLLLTSTYIGQASCEVISSRASFLYSGTMLLGFIQYIFIESYGSLVPALFWAIASDTTVPDSAKKGFSFVVAIGQIGGIVGPYFITGLPRRFGFSTSALSFFVCALTIAAAISLLYYFFKRTPKDLLVSFQGKNEKAIEKEQEPGFLEGLRLLVSQKYLLAIFAAIAFPEIITAIFDQHFNTLASQHYSGTALAEYLGSYASSVNLIALLFLLLGVSNITRYLGIGVALFLMPIIYGLAVLGFRTLDSLGFLFALMASSKAINYALNGPAIKQLYIPTTYDVRFKSQAWIETFGSRGSKEIGALFNIPLGPLQKSLGEVAGRARHALFASYLGFALVAVWFFVALFLGRKYKKAVDDQTVVC